MELPAQRLAHRRRDRHQFLRKLGERVAQAEAETCPRKQGPHTLRGAVKAIGEHPADPIGWLLLERCTLKLPIGLRKSYRTGLFGVAQMPDDAATDNGWQIDLVGETPAVLL